MPRKNPVNTLSVRDFFGEYFEDIIVSDENPVMANVGTNLANLNGSSTAEALPGDLERRLRKSLNLLRRATEKKDSEGFKRLLFYFFAKLHIEIPEGTLQPRLPAGRPNNTTSEKVFGDWIARGRPIPDKAVCEELAQIYYPQEYKKASVAKPQPRKRIMKNLRERVRQAIRRRNTATKSSRVA